MTNWRKGLDYWRRNWMKNRRVIKTKCETNGKHQRMHRLLNFHNLAQVAKFNHLEVNWKCGGRWNKLVLLYRWNKLLLKSCLVFGKLQYCTCCKFKKQNTCIWWILLRSVFLLYNHKIDIHLNCLLFSRIRLIKLFRYAFF